MGAIEEPLSEREHEVLACLAEGATNREIALSLSISPNTVKVHLRNIYAKLGVSSRTEAITVSLQQGLLTVPGAPPAAEPSAPVPTAPPVPTEPPAIPTPPRRTTATTERTRFIIIVLALLLAAAVLLLAWERFRPAAALGPAPADFAETPIGESRWRHSRPLPAPRERAALVAVGLDLYLIGGEEGRDVVGDLLVYSADNFGWRAGTPKLTAVADSSAAVLEGEIYVPGGRQANGDPTAAVEIYSPANDAWRTIPDLPQPLAGHLTVTAGGRLYVIGGWNGERIVPDVVVFDPATGEWQRVAALQQARAFAMGGAAGGAIYVAGGEAEGPLDGCERFELAAGTWSSCAELPAARSGGGAAVVLNNLYVLGGQGLEPVLNGVVYAPENDRWDVIPMPMLEEESWYGVGVANIESRIFVMGGRRAETSVTDNIVYAPFVYQFFIPAASGGN